MSKVYIVNRGPHDYSDAAKYGEIVFCTDGSLDKFDLAQMHRELSDSMLDSEPEDHILLTSLTSLCSVACSIFVFKHAQLHVLIHRGDSYVERSLYFDN